MPLKKPRRAARAARSLKDAGQTTVEYVVVIAIIIGLGAALTAFAVTEKGSIADAANSVGNMFSHLSGAGGGSGGGDEGAGGSGGAGAAGESGAGAGSGHVGQLPSAAADAASWTLAQQKAVAEDISAKGTSSAYYAKAQEAMENGQNWTVELTDGSEMPYYIIGMLQDDKSDGSGKAGLTFQFDWEIYNYESESALSDYFMMNENDSNAGGWAASELRQSMNSGEIWQLLPKDMQAAIVEVSKSTNNAGGGAAAKISQTNDKLWLLSLSEYVPAKLLSPTYSLPSSLAGEGSQYELYQLMLLSNQDERAPEIGLPLFYNHDGFIGVEMFKNLAPDYVWLRSVYVEGADGDDSGDSFFAVNHITGEITDGAKASEWGYIWPAWCF